MATETKQVKVRRDSAADWTTANPTLAMGERGLDETNMILKIGDGVTAWADLEGLPVDPDALATDLAARAPFTGAFLSLTDAEQQYAETVPLVGAGIDWTGATDSTTAVQAKIDAAPDGATLVCPVGILEVSSVTLDSGKSLQGSGWWSIRDAAEAFGDAAYLVDANFGGTVLRSTATTGKAIDYVTTGVTAEGGRIADLILIGPGSGTSVGLQVGAVATSVINPKLSNVKVCNFATGYKMQNVNEGVFDISVRGCTTGVALSDGVNNNSWRMLNMQRCTTGLSLSSDCLGNGFHEPISQNNGTGFSVNGDCNTFYTPYAEVSATYAFDFVDGNYNTLITPLLNNAADAIRIQAAADFTQIIGFQSRSNAPIEDNGSKTLIIGNTTYVTGTGTNRAYIDLSNNRTVLPLRDATGTATPVAAGSTASRPTATAKPAGLVWFNTSTAKPNYTDGAGNWRDATGAVV